MAVLFVSHASRDDAAIRDLEAWLQANGFTDRFVDHSGIDAGEKWRDALRNAAGACRVVLLFVTEAWLNSEECFGEFKAAWYMGKRLLPLFALDGPTSQPKRLAEVRAEDQGIDVAKCFSRGRLDLASDLDAGPKLEAGLRAAGALTRIGLDPEAFEIDKKLRQTPFPGLASFADEDADAALFYGRGREIALTLEELREMRARGDFRPYVILGASGSGKSSLLKAGVIPRLRREAPAWLPLRAFRPGDDPLRNFADALSRTLADHGQTEAPGLLRDRLSDVWTRAGRPTGKLSMESGAPLQAELDEIGARLRKAADRPGATILVAVDQAEELARAEGASGDALAAYLRAAATATANRWRIALTIRDDSWPELRKHARFEDWEARLRDLPSVKGHRFADIVEEPARRYGVRFDADLVEALMKDASGDDALPLLAYGLERLWRDYHASGELTLAHYERVGRLGGLIDRAAERALQALPPETDAAPAGAPSSGRLALAAATFVPALAQVNEKGEALRRIADWAGFTEEQRGLLRDFDAWRLVVRKGDPGTVEVAHEALFREWKRLAGWLEPERARLEALRSLQVDALTWDRNGQDGGFLNHRGKRLADAVALGGIEGYAKRLGKIEADYLAGCRAAEALERRRERRVRAALGALLAGVILFLLGWINHAFVEEKYDRVAYGWPYWLHHFSGHALSAEAERALKAGDHFRECNTGCPEMIVVPAGRFTMGSPDGTNGTKKEEGRYDDESPLHPVVIAHAFAVGVNDVTFDDWDSCYAARGCATNAVDYGMKRGNKPVVGVSWEDAKQYAAWLKSMTGADYRLLSEAEWEYAARAKSTTAYYWGDEFRKGLANCKGCGTESDYNQTSPVGSFPANDFGLFEMAGNVWQWVEDCYRPFYRDSDGKEAPTDGTEWKATGSCVNRVGRGGSWFDTPDGLRAAVRYWDAPVIRGSGLGFRVARTLTP